LSVIVFDNLKFQHVHTHQDFDREVMESMKLVDAGIDGSVAFEMTIVPNFSNLNSTNLHLQSYTKANGMLDVMHGGAAGVIFDMSTTTALCPLARPGFVGQGPRPSDES
jgi:acyl-coenzyme A thioesterase 13